MTGWEPLERRELLSTTQNFEGTGGTTYSLEQVAGPPPAQVIGAGTTSSFLQLAITPTSQTRGNDNSISFVTSDPGIWNQATADWDFSVTPTTPTESGVGMSFALLNTADYGTSGNASSAQPQLGTYQGSLAFGFDTTKNLVDLSLNNAVVTNQPLTGTLNLASGVFIHAQAVVNFPAATVTLVLTPSTAGSAPVTVFNAVSVPGLTANESRVSLEAKNSMTSSATFDVANINVVYSGPLSPGTVQFGTIQNVPENLQTGLAPITIVRQIAAGFSPTGSFSVGVVAADGTAKNEVNYLAEIVQQDSSGNLSSRSDSDICRD